MSAERIDHAAEARRVVEVADGHYGQIEHRNGAMAASQSVEALMLATEAQVHATLALVEQQRITNLIALASLGSGSFEDALPVLQDEAAAALMEFRPTPGDQINGPDEFPYTRDEIREALGLA